MCYFVHSIGVFIWEINLITVGSIAKVENSAELETNPIQTAGAFFFFFSFNTNDHIGVVNH